MHYAIIDCYTDEPSGLGVPPYLGTYPRYLYGALNTGEHVISYLTIDDLRAAFTPGSASDMLSERKTGIKRYNLTKNHNHVEEILARADEIIVVAGINTPGKYLSAVPGSLNEAAEYIKGYRARKVLTGPAAIVGTRLQGGRYAEKLRLNVFETIDFNYLGINEYDRLHTERSGPILSQIPWPAMMEIESGKGCDVGRCSFCTEPLKNRVSYRDADAVIAEMRSLSAYGAEHFRLGKATCFYSYQHGDVRQIRHLLSSAAALRPKVLHIDNVNPNKVIFGNGEEITKLVAEYCTAGNIAAFGVESFDLEVVKANRLNTGPENAIKAVRLINRYGAVRGENGMPKFLPGINIILGLMRETRETLEINYRYLRRILDEGLLLRRINIRQVVPFEGTLLHELAGLKYLKKNKRLYWSWRKRVRREIDNPMLQRLIPRGTLLRDVLLETYDGNHTFGRQMGTYPIVIGVEERAPIRQWYDIEVTDWMLRSVTGVIREKHIPHEVNTTLAAYHG